MGSEPPQVLASERDLEALFDLALDLLTIVGFDGYFKRVNPAFERTLGYSSEELLSRPYLDFYHPDDLQMSRELFANLLVQEGKEIVGSENRVICADGSIRWLEWNTRVVPDEGLMYCVARDVTERRRADAEVREAHRTVEASRDELRVLAEEQAALRRAATLVARGVPAEELFFAAGEEISKLLDVPALALERYDSDGWLTVVAAWAESAFRPGTRWPLDGESLAATVYSTGRPARIDDYSKLPGPIAAAVRAEGFVSIAGAPIVVRGKVWGLISAASRDGQLRSDIEGRLTRFTELLATAISNAESQTQTTQLAEEQSALRRVATLVAQGVQPAELFAAVSDEVGRLVGSDSATVIRYDDEGDGISYVGSASKVSGAFPVGVHWKFQEGMASLEVYRTGRSARSGAHLSTVEGPIGDLHRRMGIISAVASPIVVEGRLWGAMAVHGQEPLPPDTEERVEKFTELVATAIATAESREALRELADEQVALRRVATLVAEGVQPAELFAAVSDEVGRLVGTDSATVMRFDNERPGIVFVGVASNMSDAFPLGARWEFEDGMASFEVYRTGRSARGGARDWSTVDGPVGETHHQLGIVSTVASPIVVEGRLWGAIAVQSQEPLPLDTDERLERFTELLATAIANTESRAGLTRLAEEQTALRRVATLVAGGAPPDELFAAVTEEVGHLLPVSSAAMSRFDPDGMVTTVAAWTHAGAAAFPAGSRWEVDGKNVTALVAQTGRPARIHDFSDATGAVGAVARNAGYRSAVGSPITVDGRLWGVMTAASTAEQPLPPDTEARIASFTELVATAIANAESRAGLTTLLEEQAVLRRVATLVARGAPPTELFAAVSEEAGRLLSVDVANLSRYEPDATITHLAAWRRTGEAFPTVGSRWPVEGKNITALVFETGRSARFDNYADASGALADRLRETGVRSAVGTPIIVEGHLWGVMAAGSNVEQPLPADTEARLERFTELVATAIANAESRAALSRLAEEQAALRRVATLVARGAPPAELFAAVTDEVGQLLPVGIAALGRYGSDGTISMVGASSVVGGAFAVGRSLQLGGNNVSTLVYETGRSARVDSYADSAGQLSDAIRERGLHSAVGTPIIVDGRLWGVMTASSRPEEPALPEDTVSRLASFTELLATAIANAESHEALTASRARIVAAADESSRRLERNLHDGAQQRLVSLGLELRTVEAAMPPDDALRAQVARATSGLAGVLEDLQEISRGLHPAILSEGGLRPALKVLARRSAVPVKVEVRTRRRLAKQVEAAAYYIASEALTNATKHAGASIVELHADVRDGILEISICDDGIGGADPSRGSGLIGLTDRVEALGGTISVVSPPGEGTSLHVRLPIA